MKNPKTLDMIRKVSPGYFGNAVLAVVVCSDRKRAYKVGGKLGRDYLCIADCAMAVENMLLAAYAVGLGSCPFRSFSSIAVKEILEIPGGIEPELLVIIGYPDKRSPTPQRFALEKITYVNKYGEKWIKRNEGIPMKRKITGDEYLFEILIFLATSARGCVDEPPLYGPFRLIDALSKLIDLPTMHHA